MTPFHQDPPVPFPRRGVERNNRRAFTLIEVVLAIGLTAMVVYLLTTATELYLANVDASRSRVETAQLARTLLDQIASDLASARLAPPASSSSPSASRAVSGPGAPPNGAPPGGAIATDQPGSAPGASGSAMGGSTMPNSTMPSTAAAPASTEGVYGNAEQIRIDRAPYANWERAARAVDVQEASSEADMAVSVRYYFENENRITSQTFAQKGVGRQLEAVGSAGLYRETIPLATITPDDPPLPARDATRPGAKVELLAPEVVAFELAYFDGTDYVDEWDPVTDRGLPRAVEIRLTLAEPRFQSRPSQDEQDRLAEGRYLDSERTEYRRFVRLPLVAASPAAQALLPAAGQQAGGGARGGPAQGGPGQGAPGQGGGSGLPDGQGGGQPPGGGP